MVTLKRLLAGKSVRSFGLLLLFVCEPVAVAATLSHAPMRPLPVASDRPLGGSPAYFVDATGGHDNNDGEKSRPWKTLGHAVAQLSPGDTLYLRGGTWFERITIGARGTSNKPVTIRSYPGELAVIDGGLREFTESPGKAWEPVLDGADDEFRSTRTYAHLDARPGRTNLLGNFADSMIPLHGYRFLTDLRSNNHLFHRLEGGKTEQGNGLYCGPGVFLDPETHRIHVRLAPTNQPSIGEANNYRGETDPRKTPLIIAGAGGSPLELNQASHVVLQDLVVRGARDATINLVNCSNITLDGVTSYGGSSALRVERTGGLRCVDSAFRGIAAPWLWRWSLKYRSIEARIISASQWNPPARGNRDFEFAYCEFTDCVDGVFIGNVDGVSIHHCLLDNVSDDGFFITCRTAYDGSTPGGDFQIHHNRISRVLTAVAFGVGHGRQKTINNQGHKQLGKPTIIRNNVFDLRETVLYQQPVTGPITTFGRTVGDHGSPTWESIDFVGNSVFYHDSPWRNYYGGGLAKSMGGGTCRRIVNNLFVHQHGKPGDALPDKKVNLQASGNQHWSNEAGASLAASFLKRFRTSPLYSENRWTVGDVYASPDDLLPDVGAGDDVAVGVGGRLTLYGNFAPARATIRPSVRPFKHEPRKSATHRVALVLGYPAFDGPLLQFAFEKANYEVDVFDQSWLPAEQFVRYDCIALVGSTTRAKMDPSGFATSELPVLRKYFGGGGTVIIGRELMQQLFPNDEGRQFIKELFGTCQPRAESHMRILQPTHPWIKHFDAVTLNRDENSDWLNQRSQSAICLSKGNNLIGDSKTFRSILADVPVGSGRVIYVGWDLSRLLPSGRRPSTPADELAYEEQFRIYEQIAADVLRR